MIYDKHKYMQVEGWYTLTAGNRWSTVSGQSSSSRSPRVSAVFYGKTPHEHLRRHSGTHDVIHNPHVNPQLFYTT
ncbi:hypothetical protein Pdw03_5378 [Penicillium digitatum]|uniref:Uncharacterized protein n=1 Tax=Penicillium digitatum TaxID=36651 RepID=A0A7T6XV48_PENDI|nr:hypothetical protein Pdw03_5378 [Penicillium digitatum]